MFIKSTVEKPLQLTSFGTNRCNVIWPLQVWIEKNPEVFKAFNSLQAEVVKQEFRWVTVVLRELSWTSRTLSRASGIFTKVLFACVLPAIETGCPKVSYQVWKISETMGKSARVQFFYVRAAEVMVKSWLIAYLSSVYQPLQSSRGQKQRNFHWRGVKHGSLALTEKIVCTDKHTNCTTNILCCNYVYM